MTQPTSGANLALAEHYLEVGRPEQALQALERPGEGQLDEPFYWYLRAAAFYDLENYWEATTAARKGLSIAPESIFLLYLLSNIQWKRGNLAAAEEAILKVLHMVPDAPQFLCTYALLTATGGQLEKSERLLERARLEQPDYPTIVQVEMILAHLRGKDKDVVRRGQGALSADPDDILGHYLIGQALQAQGRVRGAERFMSNAARLAPTNRAVTSSARATRYLNHWLLLPLWPVQRFGGIAIWLAAVVTIALLAQLENTTPLFIFALFYLAYVGYTWVVPPLLLRWLRHRRRFF